MLFAGVFYSQIPSPCILFGILEYLRRRRQNNLWDLCKMHVVSMHAARRRLDYARPALADVAKFQHTAARRRLTAA